MDDILRKEGIEEENLGSKILTKSNTKVIGRVEDQNGDELEEAVVVTRTVDGNRIRKSGKFHNKFIWKSSYTIKQSVNQGCEKAIDPFFLGNRI